MFFLLRRLPLLLACLVGIGLCLGGFSFSSSPGPDTENDKVNISVSVDKGKIESDVAKVEKKSPNSPGRQKSSSGERRRVLTVAYRDSGQGASRDSGVQ
jgi:hypothetical protein